MSEIREFEEKMNKTLEALNDEYATIRAGRANPHILDKIKVDYYGTPSSIQQVANVSVPEARPSLWKVPRRLRKYQYEWAGGSLSSCLLSPPR